jgi:cyclomaltodextrinase / maltogenic alpha-amylase / neopullulanase
METTIGRPWFEEAFFYHIYPLGFCGALTRNDFHSAPVERLDKIVAWIPHLLDLGVNALYLGPVFESSYHGYDTADYYHVDRRLSTDDTLARVSRVLHQNGIRLVLDAVFNHVGRDFWAFRDVLQNGAASPYCDWFDGLRFSGQSPYGDPFTYKGWAGNFDLVKLNLTHPAVKQHLFEAVRCWVEEYNIDGLRLDAADCLDAGFLKELRSFTSTLKADFWLMGEMVGGDYRSLANPEMLHSVTNYECYKGLYSSLVEKNYFEIAYALNRQFGDKGIYRGLPLYNFTDNHDVDRVASSLGNPALLYPLYCLLFTMPGVPSIYYGSEWGLTGKRSQTDDRSLRPALELPEMQAHAPQPELPDVVRCLAGLRARFSSLRNNGYAQLLVSHEQLAFLRTDGTEHMGVVLNSSALPVSLEIPLPCPALQAVDVLNHDETFPVQNGRLSVSLPPCWARVLKLN